MHYDYIHQNKKVKIQKIRIIPTEKSIIRSLVFVADSCFLVYVQPIITTALCADRLLVEETSIKSYHELVRLPHA